MQKIKQKLLEECIRRQHSLMNDFKLRLHELKESEDDAADEELDGTRLGQQAQADSERTLLKTQLEFAANELEQLDHLKATADVVSHSAEPGAVVVTDALTFYISTSVEQFNVDGKTYVGLSVQSPLFQVMKGKRPGDTFAFNKTTYVINNIF